MKIKLAKYHPGWPNDFDKIKQELMELIGFIDPVIEHIGSTSVAELSAKPIIDILIGVHKASDLAKTITPLTNRDYVYYETYNRSMPYRRFFVKHKISPAQLSIPSVITDNDAVPASTTEHDYRLAHIHVLPYQSEHWIRHIAFRDYLRAHPDVKNQYQELKAQLANKAWRDGNEYNEAKDAFIKVAENDAVNWYTKGNRGE